MNFDSSTGYKVSLSKLFNQPVFHQHNLDGNNENFQHRNRMSLKNLPLREAVRITLNSKPLAFPVSTLEKF